MTTANIDAVNPLDYHAGRVGIPNNPIPQSFPSSDLINPWKAGFDIGMAGALTGVGYAAIRKRIRQHRGEDEQGGVVGPMLTGALIGISLGVISANKLRSDAHRRLTKTGAEKQAIIGIGLVAGVVWKTALVTFAIQSAGTTKKDYDMAYAYAGTGENARETAQMGALAGAEALAATWAGGGALKGTGKLLLQGGARGGSQLAKKELSRQAAKTYAAKMLAQTGSRRGIPGMAKALKASRMSGVRGGATRAALRAGYKPAPVSWMAPGVANTMGRTGKALTNMSKLSPYGTVRGLPAMALGAADTIPFVWEGMDPYYGRPRPAPIPMAKTSQSSFFTSGPLSVNSMKTLSDLFEEIRSDPGLGTNNRAQLINQIKSLTGHANGSTSLSALMAKGLGGTIGLLISKYFGMGPVGQIVSTVAGYGLGKSIHKQLNKPPDPYPGWKVL